MANISTYLARIKAAIYGEEVRGSIHDAIATINTESANAMQYAADAQDSARAHAATAAQKASQALEAAQSIQNVESSVAAKAAEAVAAAANAKASETTVVNSATAAAQKASEASASRDAALQSAAEAAQSADSAKQYSGKPPKPLDGTWWIWDAEAQDYVNSGIGCELMGPAGNGITDIELASGNHAPGTTDTYTIKMADETSYDITVYNGRDGTGAGDVVGISFELLIPASGWRNGEITIADSRFLASSMYQYFLSADGPGHDEFLACNVQPLDIAAAGFITFKNDTAPSADITVNVIRFGLSANGS